MSPLYICVKIHRRLSQLVICNWLPVFEANEDNLDRWARISFSAEDKKVVIKINITPRLIYLLESLCLFHHIIANEFIGNWINFSDKIFITQMKIAYHWAFIPAFPLANIEIFRIQLLLGSVWNLFLPHWNSDSYWDTVCVSVCVWVVSFSAPPFNATSYICKILRYWYHLGYFTDPKLTWLMNS